MSERNEKGQFLPGNKASPGRPKKATEAEYLEAIGRGVPLELFQQASAKMGKLAAGGDVQAYNAIKAHLAGLPIQKLQLSSTDAALLVQVLELLKNKGIPASQVFEALIAQLAESQQVDVYEGDENEDDSD